MKLVKLLVAAAVMPALVSPASSAAVRPSVKAITVAPVKQDRTLKLRNSARAGAQTDQQSTLLGSALIPLITLAAVIATIAVVASDGGDDPISPGS